ncbi:penicillin acylase family protein [Nocardioides sp. cx-173]|uniref:penicillin acylase family protein n=1 Tax=Nocardioides sp. cx-173 TaxID=2898796 RepID=UPI001E295DDD|nr:penicillin acylase family protein [Nocardioides sp. cx-173]MCD4526862.1 penicillin acylase family protein [Nocardioides sp. cx-173]UGB41349.1 penicillin acylase family protein [Nocardioides sp. cx-173]
MTEETTTTRGPWASFLALPRAARVTSYVAVLVVLALVAGLAMVVVLVRRPLPQTSGELALPGLGAEVEVVRDEHGVPQLYGDSLLDLVRAQGYVHAQERFFQMDVRRHATAGRLAELFGKDAVESDAYVRTMGWRRVAQRELALIEPATRAALEAYAGGVNAFLAESSPTEIALEYTALNAGGLDYHPEDWSAVDSLAWLKAMAWDLRGNMAEEIDRVLVAGAVGEERAAELYPAYPYDEHAPVVDRGAVVDGVFEQDATTGGTRDPRRPAFTADQQAPLTRVREGLGRMPSWLGRGEGLGSNAWVVDGAHSATGEPLLANDPHLGVDLPGVWMQTGLHCRRVSPECPLDVAGFTFAGVPGVMIGHNADIAWGFANLGPDVTDLFVERVRGDTWHYDGRDRPLHVRTETIEVAGDDDVELTVRATDHGPLVSDVDGVVGQVGDLARRQGPAPGEDEYAVALSWTALQPGTTADAILALNLATDWDSFRSAVAGFAAPAQSIVYADRAGHIGYQASGLVPIRRSGNDGRVPSAGWLPENDWTGEVVPYEGLPRALDPEGGVVVAANQAVIGEDDYPYFLGDDWDQGYRSERIRRLLEQEGELSVDEMAALQLDDRNPLAPVLTPYLLGVRLMPGYADDGQRLLDDWDFRQQADSAAAAYFNVVWRQLLEGTFHDELPEESRPDGGNRWMSVVTRLLEEPGSPWWDDLATEDVVETRDDILRAALVGARDELTALISPTPREWTWGDLHELDLRSRPLGESGVWPVERLVDRGGWEVGGGAATVDASGWDAREGYEVTTAASMRMVVSLGDLDASRWVSLTGVSGHPFSGHYTDQTDLWAAGETLPWRFSRDAVLAASTDTLTLVPVPVPE